MRRRPRRPPSGILPLDVANAERDGLLTIIERLRPGMRDKIWHWRHRLADDFEQRARRAKTEDQMTRLYKWYLRALRQPRLPDLRAERSFDADLRLVFLDAVLRPRLTAIFREYRSPEERSTRTVAVASRLRLSVDRDTMLPLRTVAQYTYAILQIDAPRLSLAKRRAARVLRREFPQALRAYQQLRRSKTAPLDMMRRAQRAVDVLMAVVLPQLPRPT